MGNNETKEGIWQSVLYFRGETFIIICARFIVSYVEGKVNSLTVIIYYVLKRKADYLEIQNIFLKIHSYTSRNNGKIKLY